MIERTAGDQEGDHDPGREHAGDGQPMASVLPGFLISMRNLILSSLFSTMVLL